MDLGFRPRRAKKRTRRQVQRSLTGGSAADTRFCPGRKEQLAAKTWFPNPCGTDLRSRPDGSGDPSHRVVATAALIAGMVVETTHRGSGGTNQDGIARVREGRTGRPGFAIALTAKAVALNPDMQMVG